MEVQLLIVDDEIQIRRGIELGIPWKDYGITGVFTAEDSPGAIGILEKEKIQILVTDIRMPGMTGLELAEFAKKRNPDIHVVILSGYSEFEYAKKAINIGVVEYLLKPIRISELTALIQKIMGEIDTRELGEAQQRKEKLEQSLEAYFDGEEPGDGEYERLLEAYTGHKGGQQILCMVFDFDTRGTKAANSCVNYVREQLLNKDTGREDNFLLYWGKKLVWFTFMDICRSRDQVIFKMGNLLRRMNSELRKAGEPGRDICGMNGKCKSSDYNGESGKSGIYGNFGLSAGVSEITPLKNLQFAAKAGAELLDHRLYLGGCVLIDQADESCKNETMFSLDETAHLRLCIAGFRYGEAEKDINNQFCTMRDLKIASYDFVKGTCMNLVQLLFQTLKSSGMDVEEVLEKNRQSILAIPDLLTIEQYREWVLNVYYLILTGVSGNQGQTPNQMVITALSYISMHYRDEITVDSISSYVKKSKNYFSYLFKKEMGISFTEYLNKYRIEEAKKRMETTADLNAEIAREVGFRDEKYFSAVFRKLEGCSATEYRKKKGRL